MQESYKLLYLTAPAVGEMEESIRTLRETIASAKETIAEKEALICKHNPRLFQTLQVHPSPLHNCNPLDPRAARVFNLRESRAIQIQPILLK